VFFLELVLRLAVSVFPLWAVVVPRIVEGGWWYVSQGSGEKKAKRSEAKRSETNLYYFYQTCTALRDVGTDAALPSLS
jgi:hypothetical protein